MSAAVLLIGCLPKLNEEAWVLPSNPKIVGIASPIQLDYLKTTVYLKDYFLTTSEIDSIKIPEGLKLEWEKGQDKALLIGSPQWKIGVSSFFVGGERYDVLLKATEKEKVYIEIEDPDNLYKEIKIAGTMNGWAANKSPLNFQEGAFKTKFILNPGEYQYQLEIDGKRKLDPNNPDSVDNGFGAFNSLLKVGNYRVNPPKIYTSTFDNNKLMLTNQGATDILAFWNNRLIPTKNVQVSPEVISVELPQVLSQSTGVLRVFGSNKNAFSNDIFIPFIDGRRVTDPSQLTRNAKHSFIMYFMMVDRFVNGNTENDKPLNLPEVHPKADYFGGDLAGITQKIDDGYFSDLGVNTVWLSPIVQNPLGAYGLYPTPKTKFSGYHGYWPTSSSKVDFRFGSEPELRKLIDQAHQNDINILVDYVANHVHEEHPVYKQHPDWATNLYLPDGSLNTEKWDEHRLTTWFDTFMPTLDFSKPEVIDAMTDSALFWFENYPIDGFRHDATKHIPEEFWRTLTFKLKQRIIQPKNRSIYQIGETYGSAELISSYVSTGQLDAQFDFNVYDAAIAAFARQDYPATRLSEKLKESLKYYGYHNLMGYISGNQDRARFISYADGSVKFSEDAKLAGWTRKIEIRDESAYKNLAMLHAFNMTIPGIPVIYYGDEYGVPGGNDPDNRRMMLFEGLDANQTTLRDYVSSLCKLRKNNLALIYGDLSFLHESEHVLVFARKYFEEEAIVIFNKSDALQTLTLRKPTFIESNIFTDAFSNNQLKFNTELELEPFTTYIFTKN